MWSIYAHVWTMKENSGAISPIVSAAVTICKKHNFIASKWRFLLFVMTAIRVQRNETNGKTENTEICKTKNTILSAVITIFENLAMKVLSKVSNL